MASLFADEMFMLSFCSFFLVSPSRRYQVVTACSILDIGEVGFRFLLCLMTINRKTHKMLFFFSDFCFGKILPFQTK